MKDSTKKRIKEGARKGAVKAREIAGKVKKISGQTFFYIKEKLPSRSEVKGATKATAKFATKAAFTTREKTEKIAKTVSETSNDILDSVKEGVEEAKREGGQQNNTL